MEINRANLIKNNPVTINEELVTKLVAEFAQMAKSIDIHSDVTHLRNLLKQQLNKDESNRTSFEDYEETVISMKEIIKQHYVQRGTYNPAKENNPIQMTQLGWFTFQSWNLENDKRYQKGEISHRFYFNANSFATSELMKVLIDEYSDKDVPFYFKTNNNLRNGTKDALVLYSSTEQLDNTLEILSNIEKKHPELVSKIRPPHILTSNINNWVGYASENKMLQGKDSYTGIMSQSIIDAFQKSLNEWIQSNPNFIVQINGRNIKVGDYFNESMLNQNGKEYTQINKDHYDYIYRMAHLLSVLPRVDTSFNSIIVDNLRQRVQEKHIDPDNICFNQEVLKEMEKYQEVITLSNGVKMTQQEYLEKNNITNLIPPDATVTLKNGQVLTGKDFINVVLLQAGKYNSFHELWTECGAKIEAREMERDIKQSSKRIAVQYTSRNVDSVQQEVRNGIREFDTKIQDLNVKSIDE